MQLLLKILNKFFFNLESNQVGQVISDNNFSLPVNEKFDLIEQDKSTAQQVPKKREKMLLSPLYVKAILFLNKHNSSFRV